MPELASRNTAEYSAVIRRVTVWGMVCNLALAGVKLAAGILASSQALVADAVHSLSDMVTDVAVLVGERYWTAPPDSDHPHGHGRIETLVSLFIGVLLASAGVGLGYRALTNIAQPGEGVPGWSAMVAACLSIVVKELLYRWTASEGHRVKSSALTANAWHHRADAMSSVPVALAVLGTHFVPSWGFLDPVAAVLVSVLILHAAWMIGWGALSHLLDTGADETVRVGLEDIALACPGVCSIHNLRTRYVGSGLQVDVHVQVAPELTVREGHDIAERVKSGLLEEGEDVVDALVHIEPFDPAIHERRRKRPLNPS